VKPGVAGPRYDNLCANIRLVHLSLPSMLAQSITGKSHQAFEQVES
jgi:hypothetical protein